MRIYKYTNNKQNKQLLHDALFEQSIGEFDGFAGEDIPDNYRGIALIVNDHGNVSLLKVFKNGNTRELANRV
jgi:hypothetical protein